MTEIICYFIGIERNRKIIDKIFNYLFIDYLDRHQPSFAPAHPVLRLLELLMPWGHLLGIDNIPDLWRKCPWLFAHKHSWDLFWVHHDWFSLSSRASLCRKDGRKRRVSNTGYELRCEGNDHQCRKSVLRRTSGLDRVWRRTSQDCFSTTWWMEWSAESWPPSHVRKSQWGHMASSAEAQFARDNLEYRKTIINI